MGYFRLRTYAKAIEERNHIQNYIDLVDEYKVHDVKKFIIKHYALTNSTSGVIRASQNYDLSFDKNTITREYIIEVIKSRPIDELHKIVRQGYIKRYGK